MRHDLKLKAEEDIQETPAELLEQLVFAGDADLFGELFQALATNSPQLAVNVLKVARSSGLQTVPAEEALGQLTEEDLLPLLKAEDPEVREEAVAFLAQVG
jgi:hypothetical protein